MNTVKTFRSPPAPRPNDPWRHGEPTLEEVMADPLVHLLMRRDGLAPRDVWPLLRDVGLRLGQGRCPAASLAA